MGKREDKKQESSMRKFVFYFIIIFISIFLTSCIPGVFFELKNITGKTLKIDYIICDDLLYDNIDKIVSNYLKNNETTRINFSLSKFNNRGVTKNEYLDINTFLSIFENIDIAFLDNDFTLHKTDLVKNKLKYKKTAIGKHVFTLLIDHFSFL
jgi:hypothetical protein